MTEQATTPLNVPTSGVRDGLGAVQDVDEGKRQVLVDIPWEVLDSYNTDFERSCFDEFLGQRMPVMCWQHIKTEPIGRAVKWDKGARANQFVAQFSDFDAVPRSRQAFAQIRDKEITDFSFYYDQAKAIAHPNTRGAIRFTKARMPEISPVTIGSIPGAVAAGVRQAADATGIAELVRTGVITEAEGREMLGMTGEVPTVGERKPEEREQITIGGNGSRSFTITIGDNGDASTASPSGDRAEGVAEMATAVDGAVSAAIAFLADVDLEQAPQGVRMAAQVLQAADVACEELLEALGVDTDETPSERSAADSTADDAGDRGDAGADGDDGAVAVQDEEEGKRAADDVGLDAQTALARMSLGRH